MKATIAICFVFVAVALARPDDKYTSRFDDVDLDEIISNEKILENYINCCLDKGKCTPDGKELKSHIQEALETKCAKCTEAQRNGTNKMLAHLINNKPHFWAELTAKYDPTGKYTAAYEKDLKTLKKQ